MLSEAKKMMQELRMAEVKDCQQLEAPGFRKGVAGDGEFVG